GAFEVVTHSVMHRVESRQEARVAGRRRRRRGIGAVEPHAALRQRLELRHVVLRAFRLEKPVAPHAVDGDNNDVGPGRSRGAGGRQQSDENGNDGGNPPSRAPWMRAPERPDHFSITSIGPDALPPPAGRCDEKKSRMAWSYLVRSSAYRPVNPERLSSSRFLSPSALSGIAS